MFFFETRKKYCIFFKYCSFETAETICFLPIKASHFERSGSLRADRSESGTVNLPIVKRIIRLLTRSARFMSRTVSAIINPPDDSMECFVAGRLQRSLMQYAIATSANRVPPPSRGVIKFILANSCRVTCSNSRGTWPGVITSPCRQPGQVRTTRVVTHFVRQSSSFEKHKGLHSHSRTKGLRF